jgi:hypothetical protein
MDEDTNKKQIFPRKHTKYKQIKRKKASNSTTNTEETPSPVE